MWHSHELSRRKIMIEIKAVHCNLCCCLLDFVGDFVSVHLKTVVYLDIMLIY